MFPDASKKVDSEVIMATNPRIRPEELEEEDKRINAQRNGLVMSVAGWVILIVAIFCSVLLIQTYRDGTHLWRYMVYALALVGGLLVVLGKRQIRQNS